MRTVTADRAAAQRVTPAIPRTDQGGIVLLQEECSTVLEDCRSRVAAGTITLCNGG